MKRPLFVLAIICSLGAPGFAQQTGFPPYGSFEDGGFDALNRQNLNVNSAIPIVQSRGRGFDLAFGIRYNSLIWKNSFSSWGPAADWGWNKFSVIGGISWTRQFRSCVVGGQRFTSWRYYNYAFIEADGTRHSFPVDFLSPYVPCEPNPDSSSGFATDNSGFFMNANAPTSPVVSSPTGFAIRSGSLKDTNGNFVSKTTNGFVDDYTDTVGRLALRIDSSVSNRIDYKFLDVSGNYQTITMYLTALNIKTNFACSGVVEYTQNGVNLPTSLSLPNGQSYTFEYEDTLGFSGYKTGRLKKVTLPTGGFYEYAYPAPNNGINCSDGTVKNLTRTLNNNGASAVWSYTRTQVGTDWKTKITPPVLPYDTAANVSTFTFNSTGQLTSEKYYQGAELSQNLRRTVNATWAANGTPAAKTVILENNQQSKVETDFDTKQKLLESREFHWGSGLPGTLARKTTFTYAPLFNRLTQVLVRDTAGNTQAKTDILYDETLPASCPTGVPQHDDAYGCSFSSRGNPTRVRRWKDATSYLDTTQTYDSLGNLLSLTDPGLHTTNFSYADSYLTGGDRNSFAYLTRITKPVPFNSQTINLKYHHSIGQLAETTNENGRTTAFSFSDDLGVAEPLNRLKKTDLPDGGQIKISYNDAARTVTKNQKRTSSPTDDIVVVEQHDQIGLLNQTQLPGGRKVDVSYDPHGRQWKVTNPYVNLTDPTYGEIQTKLDALGRVKTVVRQDGNSAQFTYAGNAVKATDETSKQGVMEIDALGRATKVCEITAGNPRSPKENCGIANFSTSEGYVTAYAYNLLGNITQSTQGGQTRTSSYDFLGRRTASLIPEVSTATNVTYGYDADSNLISVADPRGNVNLEYDELHRLKKKKHGTTLVSEYTYDGTAANNAIGRLITDTDGAFGSGADHSDYIYDPLGRILTANRTVSGTPYAIAYQYDFMGNLTQFSYPSGRVVTYAYNASAELSQVHDATSGPGFDYVTGASYSPLGTLQQLNLANQVSTSIGWNNAARLTSILTQKSGNPALLNLGYSYNANGQIQQIVNQLVTDGTKDEKYAYDELGRLLTAQRGPDTNIQRKYSYDYDRFGNRWLQSLVAGTQGYGGQNSFDLANNRVTSTGFSYDNSGNVTANGPGTSFTFNPENFMTAAGVSVSYSVDTQGRRTKKTVSGVTTNYFYSGSVVISEKQGSAWTDYIFFGGIRVAQQSGSNLTSAKFLHADHLGSTRACSDGSGNPLGSCDYEPFGEFQPGAACSNLPTNYRFAGMQWDADAGPNGLYHTQFRYYDVNQGRWMGVDPLSGSPDNPQSADRYAYVINDPANLTDPLGLFHSCPPGCTPVHGSINGDPTDDGCSCPGDQGGRSGSGGGGAGTCNQNSRTSPATKPGQCAPEKPKPPDQPKPPCKPRNLLQKITVPALQYLAKKTGQCLGTGVGGSGAIGPPGMKGPTISVGASQQLVVTPNGQAAIVTSIAVGSGVGAGAIGGIQLSICNADTPEKLGGPFGQIGGGAGYKWALGGDLAWAPDPNNPGKYIWQLTVTGGGGLGGFGAASSSSNTTVEPLCPN